MMDHQNIAKIFDAGTTPTGNPYFVMELVNGIPLNRYCDNRRLDIRQRLELMIPVCRAIQHAHQKGIVHRDLKHSNVLVTQYDGKPVPKVIDFGLAKTFERNQKLTDKTMFTEFGKVVGTLQYMSPEQAEMNSVDVDTRSDVFSLGVMIYKLLTGTTPLDNQTISSHSLIQVLQLIRIQDPVRPSIRARGLKRENLNKAAKRRSIRPEKLAPAIEGDLDWIVMKAIEKERARRYETANGLALDLERFLGNKEVRARPPSTYYRLEKLYQRNKRLVAAILLLAIVLTLGIVGTSGGLILALNERDRANEKAIEAKTEARRARMAESEARQAEAMAEARLHAIRIKSAWSDWQLGNVESAWQMLNSLGEDKQGWVSRFLRTEFTASKHALHGHALKVISIDASNDGQRLATAGTDNIIYIWDAKTKRRQHKLELGDSPTQVRFSPDSKWVAASDLSNSINIWNAETGEQHKSVGPYAEDLTCFDFVGDSENILIGTAQVETISSGRYRHQVKNVVPQIRIVSMKDGSIVSEVGEHKTSLTAVDSSPDGDFLISCSLEGLIVVWQKDGEQYKRLHERIAHEPATLHAKISPDGNHFASCGEDKTVQLYDLKTGQLVQTFVGHQDSVLHVDFSPDGSMLVSACSDGTAKIWNLKGEELFACQGHFDSVEEATFSADGQEVLTASHDKTVRVWNAQNKPNRFSIRAHRNVLWAADFSPHDDRIVSVSEDGSISVTEIRTGAPVFDKIDLATPTLSVAHSPVADLFVCGGADSKLRVFSSKTGEPIRTMEAHEDFIWDIEFSASGKQLLTASSDRKFKVWSTEDWSLIKEIEGHEGELGSARYSNNGKWIVTASDDMSVKLWDAQTFDLIHTFQGHKHSVWRAIFSPADDLIASSSFDGDIIIWNVRERRQIKEIKAHQNQIAGLAFTADGERIISASDDQTIKVWDIESGIELFVLRDRDDSAIVHASFSNDGKQLVTGNQDGWLTIRSANDDPSFEPPFLPQQAVELMTDGLLAVTAKSPSKQVYERELENARLCNEYFPSYQSFTILGIAQYRLGLYSDAVESLETAQRLERLEYGEADLRPDIEGYLTLAFLKNGDLQKASQLKQIFFEKLEAGYGNKDPHSLIVLDEIEQELQSLASD